jgi:hypothetical protein
MPAIESTGRPLAADPLQPYHGRPHLVYSAGKSPILLARPLQILARDHQIGWRIMNDFLTGLPECANLSSMRPRTPAFPHPDIYAKTHHPSGVGERHGWGKPRHPFGLTRRGQREISGGAGSLAKAGLIVKARGRGSEDKPRKCSARSRACLDTPALPQSQPACMRCHYGVCARVRWSSCALRW